MVVGFRLPQGESLHLSILGGEVVASTVPSARACGNLSKLRILGGGTPITCPHPATLICVQGTLPTLWLEKWSPNSMLVSFPAIYMISSLLQLSPSPLHTLFLPKTPTGSFNNTWPRLRSHC